MKKVIFHSLGIILTLSIVLLSWTCDTRTPTSPEYEYTISLTHDVSEDETYADYGVTTVTLTAELKDEDGQFISDKTVTFTYENTDASQTYGEIEHIDSQTNANGKMRVKYKDNGQAGTIVVTATYEDEYGNSTNASDTFVVIPVEGKVQYITLISDDSDNVVLVSDDNLDSTYTTYFSAFVKDSYGVAVQNVEVDFNNLTSFGSLVIPNEVLTDSIGKCRVALYTTALDIGVAEIKAFVTKEELDRIMTIPDSDYNFNSLSLNRSTTEISDTVSVEFKLNSQSNSSLTLESDHYFLPYDDNGTLDGVTANISATMVDSLGNIPEEYTVIQFQSMKDSSGILIPFGSIDPYSFFDEDGIATATFNMSGTSGLAHVIGNSQGLTDTIHISVNPSYAVTMEMIPAYPNEIMVTGGGGQESTEISVIIKDGYGNPVGESYQVRLKYSLHIH